MSVAPEKAERRRRKYGDKPDEQDEPCDARKAEEIVYICFCQSIRRGLLAISALEILNIYDAFTNILEGLSLYNVTPTGGLTFVVVNCICLGLSLAILTKLGNYLNNT